MTRAQVVKATYGAALALTAALACACQSPGTTVAQPRVTGTTHASTSPGGSGHVRAERQVALPPGRVGHVTLAGERVLIAVGTGSHSPDRVLVAEPGTRRTRELARTAWRGGLMDWVEATGDTVVFTDQDREQSDAERDTRWRMYALDLATGRRRVLASSGNRATAWVPLPRAMESQVVWAQPGTAPGRFTEFVWAPGQAAPRAVLRDAQLQPGTESVTAHQLVYVGPPASARGAGGDIYALDLTAGSRPRPLTTTGLVMRSWARGGHVVWENHIGPAEDPAVEHLDDPYSHWAAPLAQPGSARRLQHGYSSGNVVVGDTFAAWLEQDGRIGLAALDGSWHTTIDAEVGASVPARLAADGPRLAYGTTVTGADGVERTTVTVVRVS